jgi:hypothetical protein
LIFRGLCVIFRPMPKVAIFIVLLALLTLPGGTQMAWPVTQTARPGYRATIYYVTHPGGLLLKDGIFFNFHDDTLSACNPVRRDPSGNRVYDTTRYWLTKEEKNNIGDTIASIDTLKAIINPCIMDGLVFSFSYESEGVKHAAWVGNAYNSKIYLFVDIINRHVPESFRIRYDKEELIARQKDCAARWRRNG